MGRRINTIIAKRRTENEQVRFRMKIQALQKSTSVNGGKPILIRCNEGLTRSSNIEISENVSHVL